MCIYIYIYTYIYIKGAYSGSTRPAPHMCIILYHVRLGYVTSYDIL